MRLNRRHLLAKWILVPYPVHAVGICGRAKPSRASLYFVQTAKILRAVSVRDQGNVHCPGAKQELIAIDRLDMTGLTVILGSVKGCLEEEEGLYWNSSTELMDSGRSKRVGDVVILPITGSGKSPSHFSVCFSPVCVQFWSIPGQSIWANEWVWQFWTTQTAQ